MHGKRVKERAKERKNAEREGAHTSHCFCKCAQRAEKKEVASFLREAVCIECAQVEENTGFAFCEVKPGIVAEAGSEIPAPHGSG